jgi:hypothetical protein
MEKQMRLCAEVVSSHSPLLVLDCIPDIMVGFSCRERTI